MQAMALGLAVNARGADHNRSGAYEADLSGDPRPAWRAASAHVAAAIETEDRAAVMDSLILCKFLRGVFTEPFAEWAAAAVGGAPAGTSTVPNCSGPPAGSCWPSGCSTIREGWRPGRRLAAGAAARPSPLAARVRSRGHADRRTGCARMIDAYYAARGLDSLAGRTAALPDLGWIMSWRDRYGAFG